MDDNNDEFRDVDQIQFDTSVSSSANGTIDDTYKIVVAEVHHPVELDENSESEFYDEEWLEESLADE